MGKFSNWENTFAWNHLLWLMETKLIWNPRFMYFWFCITACLITFIPEKYSTGFIALQFCIYFLVHIGGASAWQGHLSILSCKKNKKNPQTVLFRAVRCCVNGAFCSLLRRKLRNLNSLKGLSTRAAWPRVVYPCPIVLTGLCILEIY